MTVEFLSADYWENRYKQAETGWDIGSPSTPLKEYIDQLTDTTLSILIPGCGNAYEAEYLLAKGFTRITCVDISPQLCNALRQKWGANAVNIVCADFFSLQTQFDLVLEQTFFCALPRTMRELYGEQMSRLVKPGGKLVGLLFDCEFEQEGPPFGGSAGEYLAYLTPGFHLQVFERCYNSIPKRADRELFMIAERKQ